MFGETPGLPVLTPNPFAVRLSTNYKGGPSLVVDNYIDPIVDDPVYVEFAKKVLKALNAKAEQAEAEKRRLAEEARQERRNRREYVLARAKEVGLDALKWSGVGIGVGVLTFGVTKVVELPKDFDDRDIELPSEGTVLSLGEKGAPAYSSEAYENPDLRPDNVPDLTDYSGSTSADTVLNDDNLIREVWLTSSKKGQNCEVRDIEEHLPLGTTLEAWTDFMAPTGQSRADELEVAYESDKVTICWVKGQELNADDDPRVLIRLRVPQEQQSS